VFQIFPVLLDEFARTGNASAIAEEEKCFLEIAYAEKTNGEPEVAGALSENRILSMEHPLEKGRLLNIEVGGI